MTDFPRLLAERKNYSRKVKNMIGSCFYTQGELDGASGSFREAMRFARQHNNKKALSIIFNNLGRVYKARGDLDEALEYYHQALAIFTALGAKRESMIVKQNIELLEGK